MTPIERQILENQLSIMKNLTDIDELGQKTLEGNIWDTAELLNPTNKEESACDMSNINEMDDKDDAEEDAFGGKKDVLVSDPENEEKNYYRTRRL